MKLYRLFFVLYRIGLLAPRPLFRLYRSIFRHGINLMALLGFAASRYGDKTALVDADEEEALTYRELYDQAVLLSDIFRDRYSLKEGRKVGLLCQNHAELVKTIYAVSSTGADLYLMNAEMGESRWKALALSHTFDLLVYDEKYDFLLRSGSCSGAAIPIAHDTAVSVKSLMSNVAPADSRYDRRGGRSSAGKLVLLTGGTTGAPKEAAHKPSLLDYLNPFYEFLSRLRIAERETAYIATPIYHGYGIGVLLLLCALGKKAVVRRGFDAERACKLVREYGAEVATVVPLMLRKMLEADADGDLRSLACVASGGAELNPKLVEETRERLGDVLFNLYGTSEAGLNLIASPQDLAQSSHTVGRLVRGSRLRIVDERGMEARTGQVGRFCIRNDWSAKNGAPRWIETGDYGLRDERGLHYLRGRTDSMIVSAGENVYPLEVEQVLLTHPDVADAVVIGVPDERFGERLAAYIELAPVRQTESAGRKQAAPTEEELRVWLRRRLARFQMPGEIVFVERLPYTSLGKPDRRRLAGEFGNRNERDNENGAFRGVE